METIKFLLPYIKKYRKNFLMFYLGWFIDSIFTVITPIIFAVMIDCIVYYRDITVFLDTSILYVAIVIISSGLHFMIYAQHNYLMSLYKFDIRLNIFKKIQTLSPKYLSKVHSGDLINMLFSDSNECVHFVVRNIIHFINGILKGIFYLVYIYIIHIRAGVFVSVLLPIITYISFRSSSRIKQLNRDERDKYGDYLSWLNEILKGLKDLRLLCARLLVFKEFTNHKRELFSITKHTSLMKLTSQRVIDFVNLILQLSIYFICAQFVVTGEITIGGVLVLLTFISNLKDRVILRTSHSLMDAQHRMISISRIKEFLAMEDESRWIGELDLSKCYGNIDFRNIYFSYGDQKIFNGLNLSIKEKSTVAIVGRSGCGKSSLISLLTGLYPVSSGSITIDGTDITNYTLKSLRNEIGVINQDYLIINGTIRDNLLLGNKRITDEKLKAVCRDVGLDEFIDLLPEQFDSILGEDGIELSGGQKQRIIMARTIIKDPPILILDEATSALDRDLEIDIQENWKRIFSNRTVIIIAHTYHTIVDCDYIYQLDQGRVINHGTVSELLKNSQSFNNLFINKEIIHNG